MLLGNSIADWIVAGVVAFAVWSGLWIVRRKVAARYKRYSGSGNPTPVRLLAYLIGNTKQVFFLGIVLFAVQESLNLAPRVHRVSSNIVLLLLLLQLGVWAARSLHFYLELKESGQAADRNFAGSLDIINFVGRILIWSVLVLVALDNFGVNITALLAGLGVGGVAVALALQNVLGDLFASLSIALDKPFVIGDSLVIDSFAGKVEHIGIKTTRLRSENGEQIILSNADLIKSRVRNYGRAEETRALATVRVAYDTPPEKLAAIPATLERIVRAQPEARFERCWLKSLGESDLQYELSFFVRNPAAHPLPDLQHAVHMRIIEEFRMAGIQFAHPTRRLLTDPRP
ncbi:MAG: mechanosensitive ion channel family protein [Steroidobacteraceae bacterium]|jgi:small-conductance mechanosensitive channel